MAEDKVQFELVSPERLLLSREVDMVVVPGSEGDMGILPRHAPAISTVRPGTLVIYEDGKVTDRIFIAGGFAEITGERCTVLAEQAMLVEDIDRDEITRELGDLREDIAAAAGDSERAAAEAALAVAEAKLAALDNPIYS